MFGCCQTAYVVYAARNAEVHQQDSLLTLIGFCRLQTSVTSPAPADQWQANQFQMISIQFVSSTGSMLIGEIDDATSREAIIEVWW